MNIYIYMNIALRRFLHNHGNIATEGSPKPGLCPTLISNDFKFSFIVHSNIGSTVHYMPSNSLEHYICTATMTNIRPDRDLNLVPPGYKPQSMRMSHRGLPSNIYRCIIKINKRINNTRVSCTTLRKNDSKCK